MKPLDEATVRNVKKFLRYGLEQSSFAPSTNIEQLTLQAIEATLSIRGVDRAPAIIIHGIMPRSGTVYVGELLRLHPDIHAFPNHIWEFPFLPQAPRVLDMENEFLWSYEQNIGKIGPQDFLPLFGSSLIAYLHAATPPGKRMLLKVPSVEHLDLFFHAFPHEHLLMLVRDGRDMVQSTLRTWPQLRFSMVCTRWRRATEMVLACHDQYQTRAQGYWLGRFEDAIAEPEVFVRAACDHFGLDPNSFPYDRIQQIPVRGSSTTTEGGKVTWKPVAKNQNFRPIGRWQQWSNSRKRVFKRLAGRALIDLGYAEDQNW